MDWIPFLKLGIALVVLSLASWSDWKTRIAPNSCWIIMGTAGIVFLVLQMIRDGVPPLFFLFLIVVSVFFYDIFWDRKGLFEGESGDLGLALYTSAVLSLVVLIVIYWNHFYLWKLVMIIVVILLIIALYYFDVIKGGADAKALIALTILFPAYPVFDSFPLISIPGDLAMVLFPFSLLVLFNAALFMMVFPLFFMIYNIIKGDIEIPFMFFGYRTRVSEAKDKFVWSMERVENGQIVRSILPNTVDEEKNLSLLETHGAEYIWVTPKIPFLIPITASLVFSSMVGNIFFYFF